MFAHQQFAEINEVIDGEKSSDGGFLRSEKSGFACGNSEKEQAQPQLDGTSYFLVSNTPIGLFSSSYHHITFYKRNSGKYLEAMRTYSMQRLTPLKTNAQETAALLLDSWCVSLQQADHAVGTVKKYTQAITHFLAWYEQEEHHPLQLSALTPIALIGYRNDLQHEQHKSLSTINLRMSALRAWCAWLVEQAISPSIHLCG